MTERSRLVLFWSPRLLGVLVCLFLSLFALDAFAPGKPFIQALPDFALHVAPMIMLLGIVALSWRWEWIGGVVFSGLAVLYAFYVTNRFTSLHHPSWILAISVPLLVVGALFLWNWMHHDEIRVRQHP